MSKSKLWPQGYARIGGVMYLIIIAAGLFAEAFVRARLIVPGDALSTAANIQANDLLFRVGIVADLSTYVMAIALTSILYFLLRPVDEKLALLMLLFNLAQDAVGGINVLNTYSAVQTLAGSAHSGAFTPEQLGALALSSLERHSIGFGIALIFFGFSCLTLGYLIFRSGFAPKLLGVLMGIAGVCYLVNSFAAIVSPAISSYLFPSILLPAFVGELSLALWLTVRGVDAEKWWAGPAG